MKKLSSLIIFLSVIIGTAQVQSGPENVPTSSPEAEKQLDKTDIFLLGQEPKDDDLIKGNDVGNDEKRISSKIFTAGIGDSVVIHLNDTDKTLIYDANCLNRDGTEKKPCTKRNMALYLNGLNIAERKYDELINANRIVFRLGYHDNKEYNNKQQWHKLLGSPTWGNDFFEKPVSVTVGLANTVNSNELITVNNDKKFSLQKISVWKFWFGLLIFLFILWKIYKLAPGTGLLRNGNKDTQWSLARCQMAFWFILIIYSFLFVWGITGAMDTITPQTLVMMGLSSGTLLGAALIDISQDENTRYGEITTSIQRLTAENIALNAQLATPPPAPADAALTALRDENVRRITALTAEINRLKDLDKTSNHFWKDILSDRTGSPVLHRFQIAGWTIVLGFIFVFSVWKDLTMPSFSDTLLALMGLSSITYLGFKVPENKQ